MKHRDRWEVAPSRIGFGWQVTRNGVSVQWTIRKRSAVELAVAACVAGLVEGRNAELRIKRKNGTIEDARTYGSDPRKTKG